MQQGELKSNIETLRKSQGLKQTELAIMTGVNTSTIRNWEKGRTGLEIFEYVAHLCEALKCSPSDLIERVKDETSKESVKKIATEKTYY